MTATAPETPAGDTPEDEMPADTTPVDGSPADDISADATPSEDALPRRSAWRGAELGLAVYGLVAAVVVLLDVPGPVRALVALTALLLLPGWTILRLFPAVEPATRLVFTVVGSIVVATLLDLALVWTHLWHPRVVTVGLLVVSAVVIASRPTRIRAAGTVRAASTAPALTTARAPSGGAPRSLVRRTSPILWIALAVACALWIIGLVSTDSTSLGQLGLLAAFPVSWYASVVIVFVVILVALFTSRRAHGLLAASLGTLIAILFSSANFVENAPRLPWVYKHIAVTNYIGVTGGVDPSIDLYNRWPGFFAFSAQLGAGLGLRDAVSYASYAELFFALVDAVLVLAIARTISRHRRWAWTAAVVFSIGNWVGQNYYSPQAFAFMLYLTAVLLALTALGGEPGRAMRRFEGFLSRPARRLGRAVNTELLGVTTSRRSRILAVVAVLGLQVVISTSHQLTPYMAILALFPLFLLGYLRPLWVGIVVVVLPVLYLLPNLDYVQTQFGLFSSFNPFANATTASASAVGASTAATLQSHGVVLLTALAVVLALAGFVRRILNGHIRTTLVVAWLAFAPVFTLFGQTYGGEGKFRIFLFGLPFYAMGVSWLFWTKTEGGRHRAAVQRARGIGLVISLTVLLSLFVSTYYQPEASLRIAASDVKASQWLDRHFEVNDTLFSVTDTFPVLVGPHYRNYLRYAQITTLTDREDYGGEVTAASIGDLISGRIYPGDAWIVFSDAQRHAAVVSGTFTKAQLARIEAAVASESVLRYDHDGVRIYESR